MSLIAEGRFDKITEIAKEYAGAVKTETAKKREE